MPTPNTADAMKRHKAGKAGFTDKAHLKAKGLIPRADGTKKVSPKYEKKGDIVITLKGKEVSRHTSERDARSAWHKLRKKHGNDVKVKKEETELEVSNLVETHSGVAPVLRAYYTRDYVGNVKIDFEHDDWKWMSRDEMLQYPLAPGVLDIYDGVISNV